MRIRKVLVTEKGTTVQYSTDEGDYKVTTHDPPHLELTTAIGKLKDIFSSRLDLEEKSASLVVQGIESKTDRTGTWTKVIGIYRANNLQHKLVTGKMREPEFLVEEVDDHPENYPDILSYSEGELIDKVVEEAEAFVTGKRIQGELDFDESEEDTDGSENA